MNLTILRRWARELTTVSLALWGVVHVAGGLSLVSMEAAAGLQALAPRVGTAATSEPGQAAAALLHFHGLNIAAAGVATVILAVTWRVTGRTWQLWVGLGLAAVLDLGLLIFLLSPGLMPLSQGFPGPVLLALALVGTAFLYRRPRSLTA